MNFISGLIRNKGKGNSSEIVRKFLFRLINKSVGMRCLNNRIVYSFLAYGKCSNDVAQKVCVARVRDRIEEIPPNKPHAIGYDTTFQDLLGTLGHGRQIEQDASNLGMSAHGSDPPRNRAPKRGSDAPVSIECKSRCSATGGQVDGDRVVEPMGGGRGSADTLSSPISQEFPIKEKAAGTHAPAAVVTRKPCA
jgi:hypothetical protein